MAEQIAAVSTAYACIGLANDPAILSVMRELQAAMPDPAIEWQPAPVLHATLVYATSEADDGMLSAISREIHLPAPLSLSTAGIGVFENDAERALHLRLAPSGELAALQGRVYQAFASRGLELSPYSAPDAYTPHVTLAYLPLSVEVPAQQPAAVSLEATCIWITRGDYAPFAEIRAPQLYSADPPMWRYFERFNIEDPQGWFRVLPVGNFRRFGRSTKVTYEMVQEMAANFGVVPDNSLPVNPEHKDEFGRLGDIAAVEAREDGLYARFAWLPRGLKAIAEKWFRYLSPEIQWGPTDYDGRMVSNVLIGAGLTNYPYFGAQTALYSLNDLEVTPSGDETPTPMSGGAAQETADPDDGMTESNLVEGARSMTQVETSTNPIVGLLQRLIDLLSQEAQPAPDAPPEEQPGGELPPGEMMPGSFNVSVNAERFAAVQQENTTLKAQIEDMRTKTAQAERAGRVSKYSAQLGDDLKSVAEQLADLPDTAKADLLAEQFAALKAQANPDLFSERGTSTPNDLSGSDAQKFLSESERIAKEKNLDMAEAFSLVAAEHPEWAEEYRAKSGRKEKIR